MSSASGDSSQRADSMLQKSAKTPRHEWYQTDGYVTVTFLVKGVKEESLDVRCDSDSVDFRATDEHGDFYSVRIPLSHKIKEQCETNVMRTKVEVKLFKAEGSRWAELERKKVEGDAAPAIRNQPKKWNDLERQIKQDEAEEKPEGDAALMKLFQDIYGSGSEETKKAMIKSFRESNGTVLSTNWSEVKEKPVEVKSPDGMEYKKWEQ